MTETGCQQCGENTFSGDGASSCTSCPDGMLSAAGSTSEEDCSYSMFEIKLFIVIRRNSLENKYSRYAGPCLARLLVHVLCYTHFAMILKQSL